MIDLKRLMFDMSLSQRELAQIIGTAQSEISHFANGKRSLKGQHLQSLIAHFGQEIIDSYTIPNGPLNQATHQAEVRVLSPEVVEEIKSEMREELRKEMQSDTLTLVSPNRGDYNKSIPFIGRNIATAPDLNVRELIESKREKLELFPIWKMLAEVDYVQTVITMAMAPRYLPGDYLFISFHDTSQVLSGKIYLTDTRRYGTMLRHVYIEDGGYTLKATNPNFKDVYVKNEDVYSISSVILSVNTNTSLTSEVNLADMVKKRDTEIENLTTSQVHLVEAQQRFLDELIKQNERIAKLTDKLMNDE